MRAAIPVALALFASAGLVSAQETGQLTGFIWDASQAVVPGATVIAVNEENGFRRETQSDGSGVYVLPYLYPGFYKLTVRADGFRTLVRFGLKLDAAESARVDFHLQIGDVQEVVTVSGDPVLLDANDGSVSTLIGRHWLESMPLNGRGLSMLVQLAPGTVMTPATQGEAGQFSVNGQRPNTNYFSVDGVSANTGVSGGALPAQMPGGSLPNMTAFGSFHALTSVEGLDEFRMQTSSATPEYGRSPGAQIELSSSSGSNEFHGLLYGALRNEALDANDWFRNQLASSRLPLRFEDFGATLGGPLQRNRTFFFLSYEGLRLDQPYTWQATVPSLAARTTAPVLIQPLLDAFPAPNGPDLGGGIAAWTGSTSRPSSFDGGSVRIDQALTSRLLLFGRYTNTPSSTQYAAPQINTVDIASQSSTIGLNATLSPSFTDEFRVNNTRTRASSVWRGDDGQAIVNCYTDVAAPSSAPSCDSFYRFSVNGVEPLIAGTDSDNRQGQWNFANTIQFRRGVHQLSFGGDFRRLTPQRDGPATSISVTADSMQALLRSAYSIAVAQSIQDNVMVETGSLFAQDTWRMTPRLTVTYGARWDVTPPPEVPPPFTGYGPPPPPGTPQEMPIWSTNYGQVGPRMGLAYRVTDDGRTVIRAGAGLYYDPDFAVALDGINGAPYNVWRFNSGPLLTAALTLPTIVSYGFAPHLKLPSTWQWNVTAERALTSNDALSVGYVGSMGQDLLRRELGADSSAVIETIIATNDGESRYDALQAQYRHRFALGWQGLFTYTWSHSIDNGSADSAVYWDVPGTSAAMDRGSSDFDVRHAFTAALSWDIPAMSGRFAPWTRGWSLDGIFQARTGFPLDVLDAETVAGLSFANVFRPDVQPGVPVWLADPAAPGGRRLNPAAFSGVPEQGDLGRNAIRGFGMTECDTALRRTFAAGEKRSLEVRLEAFNVLNHPTFADPVRYLSDPLFGQSTSMMNLMLGNGSPSSGLTPAFQSGGPRSMQLVLRFHF
jgi:Carboxypeptidase regulatory-like domain/TonB dependent receptor-like, beta-barrel